VFSDRTRWSLTENRLTQALAEAQSTGRTILDLARSNPTECGFRYDQQAILGALARTEMLQYQPDPRGILCAREGIARYYAERQEPVGPDDLILSSGTSEGYSFVFHLLCNPGDEILIPSPSYPLFDFLTDLCDVKLVRYPLVYDHGWQIEFTALASAVSERTRGIVVVHPNNPTGHFASAAEQDQLLNFCGQQGIALIADEVFLDFSLNDRRHKSFSTVNKVLAFALSGISKICGLPQMKLAWIAVSGPPSEKKEALAKLELIADTYLSVGTPVQLALSALLGTGSSFQSQVMARVRANLRELDVQLSGQSMSSRLAFDGGWSVVLRVPAVEPDEELAIALLTAREVSIHPGHFYDFAQPGHLVASLIVPEQEFAEGIKRVLAHIG
jgi:alanine-synthesizing transaminase